MTGTEAPLNLADWQEQGNTNYIKTEMRIIHMVATQPDTDTVAVTRTFDGIEAAAHRIIEQVGGMESIMRGAKMAILKPNLVAGRNADSGSTTSFALMKAVAEEV